jgi:hypothetical protein
VVDRTAATIILQSWLDRRRRAVPAGAGDARSDAMEGLGG